MAWESVPPALRLHLTCQCIEDLNTSLPSFTQIQFFFFFHHSSLRSCYHIHYHCTGITSTAYARGTTTTPSGGMQTTMPPLPLSLSPHTCHHCHRLHLWGMQVKLCFFSSFFISFLTIAETSFPHMLGPQTPTSSPYLTPQASQVPPLPLPHLWAHK